MSSRPTRRGLLLAGLGGIVVAATATLTRGVPTLLLAPKVDDVGTFRAPRLELLCIDGRGIEFIDEADCVVQVYRERHSWGATSVTWQAMWGPRSQPSTICGAQVRSARTGRVVRTKVDGAFEASIYRGMCDTLKLRWMVCVSDEFMEQAHPVAIDALGL